jgi:hypothetical protein
MRILFLLSALVINGFCNAAVLTVSNTMANPGQYNKIDSAMVYAQPFDTIYIHPSLTT